MISISLLFGGFIFILYSSFAQNRINKRKFERFEQEVNCLTEKQKDLEQRIINLFQTMTRNSENSSSKIEALEQRIAFLEQNQENCQNSENFESRTFSSQISTKSQEKEYDY